MLVTARLRRQLLRPGRDASGDQVRFGVGLNPVINNWALKFYVWVGFYSSILQEVPMKHICWAIALMKPAKKKEIILK